MRINQRREISGRGGRKYQSRRDHFCSFAPCSLVLSAVSIVAETLLPASRRSASSGSRAKLGLPTRPHSIQNGETTTAKGRGSAAARITRVTLNREWIFPWFPAAAIAAFRCFMRAGLLPDDRHRFRSLPAPVTHIYRFYFRGLERGEREREGGLERRDKHLKFIRVRGAQLNTVENTRTVGNIADMKWQKWLEWRVVIKDRVSFTFPFSGSLRVVFFFFLFFLMEYHSI